jgi:cytochrome c-type biogenesis protein CcmH/NrfG
MAAENEIPNGYIKKGTVIWIAGITLAVGFLMGVVFSAYKSPKKLPIKASMPSSPPAADRDLAVKMSAQIFELEKQTVQNPQNADIWTQLGNLYFDTGNFEKAINAYQKSLALRPDNANIWTDLGIMYRRSGKPAEAVKAFDKAIKTNPRHESSRFNKGIVLMHEMNDIPGAVEAWEGLVAVNPNAKTPGGQPVVDIIKRFKANTKP